MPSRYYTQSGEKIRNPQAYAQTGAPMYQTKYQQSPNINQTTYIYKLNLQQGKKYIGKTTNIDRRMYQHFSGNGSMVTKKFKPKQGQVIDLVPGFFSDDIQHQYTKQYIQKQGYENVRGGKYCNSKTLKKITKRRGRVICYKCREQGHYAPQCSYSDSEQQQ